MQTMAVLIIYIFINRAASVVCVELIRASRYKLLHCEKLTVVSDIPLEVPVYKRTLQEDSREERNVQ